jgi:hypothetical protein
MVQDVITYKTFFSLLGHFLRERHFFSLLFKGFPSGDSTGRFSEKRFHIYLLPPVGFLLGELPLSFLFISFSFYLFRLHTIDIVSHLFIYSIQIPYRL